MHIGILDDNPSVLSFLGDALRLEGHTVDLHSAGGSLLAALQPALSSDEVAVPYDLLILDLMLPTAPSGLDVFREVRRHLASWQLPVIVITAIGEPTLSQYRQLLPDDVIVLSKPVPLRKLRAALSQQAKAVQLHSECNGTA